MYRVIVCPSNRDAVADLGVGEFNDGDVGKGRHGERWHGRLAVSESACQWS